MSISAKVTIAGLRFVKKIGLFPKYGNLNEETARAREYNKKHIYRQPSDRKALYSTDYIEGYPILSIKQKNADHKTAILFLHGGGNKDTWKMEVSISRNYGKQTGADVIYPIYPPFTEVPVADTANLIYEVYKSVVSQYGARNITVLGGSYGGLLTMQLITWINKEGNMVEMPGLLIMNSPFAFPETEEEWALVEESEKDDLMVSEGAFKLMLGGVLRADPQTPGYAMYPGEMDFHHAPETYVFYAKESCASVSDSIQKAFDRDGAVLHMSKEPGMMHCYACVPIFPESRRDFKKQIALIKEWKNVK